MWRKEFENEKFSKYKSIVGKIDWHYITTHWLQRWHGLYTTLSLKPQTTSEWYIHFLLAQHLLFLIVWNCFYSPFKDFVVWKEGSYTCSSLKISQLRISLFFFQTKLNQYAILNLTNLCFYKGTIDLISSYPRLKKRGMSDSQQFPCFSCNC